MTQINLEPHDNIISAINKIKNINDSGVEIIIPEGSVLFDNVLNLKIIKKYCEGRDLSIQLSTRDEMGMNLLNRISGDTEGNPEFLENNEIMMETKMQDFSGRETEFSDKKHVEKFLSKIGNLSFLPFPFALPKIPKLKFRGGPLIPILVVITLTIAGIYFAGTKVTKAIAKIIVNSQPLTRSLTIKVKSEAATSKDAKILKGSILSTTIDGNMEIDTTGEKLVGEKAEGKIRIYNSTDKDIKLKEKHKVLYDRGDEDLEFTIDKTITIPARTRKDETDPESDMVPGSAEVDVTAADIGNKYNIDDGKVLEIDDYKKGDLAAKSTEKFSGGKSETVKVVSADDLKNLKEKLLSENTSKAESELSKKTGTTQELIKGSGTSSVTKETFSNKEGDETAKVSLGQSVYVEGLVYNKSDMDDLLDQLVQDLIPEGYVLSDEDREVKTEALGNSTSSILNSKEADLQVTLKTYVIPNINVEDLKKQLLNKKPEEAQKVLGSIRNIKTYELKISPSIPLFKKVPSDTSQIIIDIEKE